VWTVAAISVSMSSVFFIMYWCSRTFVGCHGVSTMLCKTVICHTRPAQIFCYPFVVCRPEHPCSTTTVRFQTAVRFYVLNRHTPCRLCFHMLCHTHLPALRFPVLSFSAPKSCRKSCIIFSVVLSGLRQQEAQLSWRDRAMLRHWIHKSLKITQGHSK